MTQHTYDNESVQELLNWAKKMLETKNYPTEKYELGNYIQSYSLTLVKI